VQQPDAVVAQFLDALRKGDDRTASSLLTQRAYSETQKAGLKVQPPGTPGMTYQLGQTEYNSAAKNDAHVGSIWTETMQNGEVARLEVIWVMKLEGQGWRIAGMATQLGDEGKLVFLDFENPQELLDKWAAEDGEAASINDQPLPSIQGEVRPPQVSDRDSLQPPMRK
jgi:hypothetical protein